jgi:ADP-ribosylation factor-like protein 8
MKCWDLGGQSQYRAEWGRYTRGCNVIIFVVDANAMGILPDAKIELHRLLEDRYDPPALNSHLILFTLLLLRELATTPLLVVANKIDLEPHATEPELIRGPLIPLAHQ